MRCSRKILPPLFVAWVAPRFASAQIVNTDPLFRASDDAPWAAHLEGRVNVQRGSTRLLVLGAQASGRAGTYPHRVLLTASMDRSTANDEDVVDREFAHLRYRYAFTRSLFGEVFVQTQRDVFRRISNRSLVGAGPRYELLKFQEFSWEVSAAYIYEYEQVQSGADGSPGFERMAHRLSLMNGLKLDVGDVVLRQRIFLQPNIRDVSNVRILHQQSIVLEVNERLAANWSYIQYYDSIAPSGIAPLDTQLQASVTLDF